MTGPASARVLIAGGGIAALAAALALREHAPPGLELTLLAPGPELVLAPETVLEATGGPPAARFALAAMAADLDAAHVEDVLEAVDAERRMAGTRASGLIGYDALLVAVGALPGPTLTGALRFAGPSDVPPLRAALDGLRERSRVLFAASGGTGWTLPLYELALLAAARHPDASIAVVTPEVRPAAVFGAVASREVAHRLADAGVELRMGTLPEAFEDGRLWLAEGGSLPADLVVALPQTVGPALAGLPFDAHGFLPVDRHGAVPRVERVWAAGDATARPLKHGGLAAQQAEVAARSIAAALGAPVELIAYEPALRGLLLTGGTPRFLRRAPLSVVPSAASERPLWSAPGKVAEDRVARYLAAHEHFRVAPRVDRGLV
jgi:sulfide:quinone oxidoreductase